MKQMSRWGIGPALAVLSIIYGVIIFVINRYYELLFRIVIISAQILIIIGVVFIIIGIIFLVFSLFMLHTTFDSGKLIKTGAFRFCRNPIYSSWIVFIIPGIALIKGSWLYLTIPVVMYIILKVLVRKEENYLIEKFGREFEDYKKKTPFILPYGFINR